MNALTYPNERTDEFPNRKPVELSLAERKILGNLT
jgi:hypothetical protein